MISKSQKTVGELFREGTPIDRAMAEAVQHALRRHKRLGNAVAVWRDGRVVLVPPEEIVLEDEQRPSTTE